MPDPRVVGTTPLDPGLNDEHPFRGASPDDLGGYPSHPSRKGEAPDIFACPIPPARSRRGEAPEGSSLFRPGVEARSAEDPGERRRIQGIRRRQGVAHTSQSTSATPYGVAGSLAMPDPRVFGAMPLDPGLNDEHPFRSAFRRRFPPSLLAGRSRNAGRTPAGVLRIPLFIIG